MNWNDLLLKHILGQDGGIFALGLIGGGVLTLRYLAPRIYGGKIAALEERVADLEAEIEPLKAFERTQTFRLLQSRVDGE